MNDIHAYSNDPRVPRPITRFILRDDTHNDLQQRMTQSSRVPAAIAVSTEAAPDSSPDFERVLHCTVNGRSITQSIAVHMTLAELLRDCLGMKGTKVACDQAACGACTVLVDGTAIFSCHTLAAQAEDATIETAKNGIRHSPDLVY